MLDPCIITATTSWPHKSSHTCSRVMRQRPRVDFQGLSCMVPASSSRPQIGHQRSPYSVLNDTAMASSWLSMIVMLGPRIITATSSWLRKSSHTWSRVMRQRPWVDFQGLSCLVLTSSSRPRIGHQRSPYSVPYDAAMAFSWLSMIVMLGPCRITATSSWLRKSSHTWSRVMRQLPRVDFQGLSYLVPVKLPRPWVGIVKATILGPE